MDFLEGAVALMQFGWKVFPLAPGQKLPAIAKADGGRGCLDATDDEEIVIGWSERFPSANVGLACGLPSGLVVIDFDPRNGVKETLDQLKAKNQTFPPTVMVRTANGGWHLYYAYQAELKNSKSILGKGIDVKTTGGYVVAPPSVLDGGKPYRWLRSPLGPDLPKLPRWVIEALRPKPCHPKVRLPSHKPENISGLVSFVARSQQGSRNNSLYWAACRMAESGQLRQGSGALVEAAESAGLDKISAEKTIASAGRREKIE